MGGTIFDHSSQRASIVQDNDVLMILRFDAAVGIENGHTHCSWVQLEMFSNGAPTMGRSGVARWQTAQFSLKTFRPDSTFPVVLSVANISLTV